MMLSRGQTEGSFQRYPYSWLVPSTLGARIIDVLERIRSRIRLVLMSTNRFLLERAGFESWSSGRDKLREARREAADRFLARWRSLRSLIEGKYDDLAGERGFRQVYEGFEDRILATGILTAIATLALLYRYRRRQQQMLLVSEPIALELSPLGGGFATASNIPHEKKLALVIT